MSLLILVFLPIEEKKPPADLLADNGRDLIEEGGDVKVELCVNVRVMGAREGYGSTGALVTKSSILTGTSFVLMDRSVALCASGRMGNVVPDSNEPPESFLPSGGSLYDEGIFLPRLRVGFDRLGVFFGRADVQFYQAKEYDSQFKLAYLEP